MIMISRHPLVSATPPREPPWTLGPILFLIILCTHARVVCGLHKWDPSLILPTVVRDSSCVSPQARLKGSAVLLVNHCAVDIELLMSGSLDLSSHCCRRLQSGSLCFCTSESISTGWIQGGGLAKERCLCTASQALPWAVPRAVCVHLAV